MGFQDQLLLNAGQKYCRMLQGEHSAILSTCIKLPHHFKTFVLSTFEWSLTVLYFAAYTLLLHKILFSVKSVGRKSFFYGFRASVLVHCVCLKGLQSHLIRICKVSDIASESTVLTLKAPIATKVVCFSRLLKCLEASMANSVNPDQTCSGSTLFACILKFASNVWQLFAADDFSRRHFQIFLGTLRVNENHATELA